MTLDEMKEKARKRVEADNPGSTAFQAGKFYENLMEGTLITVTFLTSAGKEDSNLVHFGKNEMRVYRWHSDVLNAVARSKEPIWFFRLLETAGIGGVIAFIVVVVFSIFMCIVAAIATPADRASVLEVVKLSFTLILGYFFGSKTAGRDGKSG